MGPATLADDHEIVAIGSIIMVASCGLSMIFVGIGDPGVREVTVALQRGLRLAASKKTVFSQVRA